MMPPAPEQTATVRCPACQGAMQCVRHIDLKGIPEIYVFYCSTCQHVETVKQGRAMPERGILRLKSALRLEWRDQESKHET
jgi:C4-type Zn-finger protein